ncbi:hypothetical protein [Persephonella sp.]
MKMIKKLFLPILIITFTLSFVLNKNTYAKPVKVEEILTYKNSWQLDLGISYSNIEKSSGESQLILIPIGNNQAIPVFNYLGQQNINQDVFIYSLNLRYGLTEKLEIFTYVNFFSNFQRTTYANGERESKEDHRFNSAGIGFSYQVLEEDKYPALLISVSSQVANNTNFSNGYKVNYFKHYKVTLTSYYTVDPIVFFMQASYTLNLKEKNKDQKIDLGERFSFSPQIYFAINPYTTINWGFRWYIQGKDKINGEYASLTQTRTSFLFGASYEITNSLIFNLDYEYQPLSNGYQSSISTRFTYKF